MAKIDDILAAQAAQATAIKGLSDDLTAGVTALTAEIARVEALIAAGSPVTPAQLQSVLDGLATANTSLATADTTAKSIKSTADAERP